MRTGTRNIIDLIEWIDEVEWNTVPRWTVFTILNISSEMFTITNLDGESYDVVTVDGDYFIPEQ